MDIVYNFIFRLSGNTKIAEVLTQQVILTNHQKNRGLKLDLSLLKQAWEGFRRYYGSLEFRGDDPVSQAILSLTPEKRCAVVLRDILGYSYGEIASVMDESAAQTARLISRGRRELAEARRILRRKINQG